MISTADVLGCFTCRLTQLTLGIQLQFFFFVDLCYCRCWYQFSSSLMHSHIHVIPPFFSSAFIFLSPLSPLRICPSHTYHTHTHTHTYTYTYTHTHTKRSPPVIHTPSAHTHTHTHIQWCSLRDTQVYAVYPLGKDKDLRIPT